jgi:protein translocase SecG subunit
MPTSAFPRSRSGRLAARSPKIGQSMAQIRPYLVIGELVISFLLMSGVLLQTPKATGLGGTIGGGGGDFGGGYRTRRGLERQLYWTTWVLVFGFLAVSLANILVATHLK